MEKYTAHLMNRSCRICASTQNQEIANSMRSGPQLKTVICSDCSLVFTNPLPSQDNYYAFYANDYEKHYGKSTASQPIQIQPDFFAKLSTYKDFKNSDFLEIGPGRGNVIFHAAKLFKSVLGVEPSEKFSEYLENDLKIPTLTTTGENFFETNTKTFDVVAMFHVLEHIYDPNIAFQGIRKALNKDGIVVIEVPNVMKPFRNLDHYFLRFVHPFNFSPFTLSTLLIKNGFEIIHLEDGENEWIKPENILVFAKKIEQYDFHFDRNTAQNEVVKVLKTWKNYRIYFENTLKSKWFYLDLKKSIKNQLRKIVRPIKKLLKS